MELGIVGLGRMGANIARRLMRDGHKIVAFDVNPDAVSQLEGEGAEGAASLQETVAAIVLSRVCIYPSYARVAADAWSSRSKG